MTTPTLEENLHNLPKVHSSVDRKSVRTLAERLFRKSLAAQYVPGDHSFLSSEDKLIAESVKEIRSQLLGVPAVHLTIAGIHLLVMESARREARDGDLGDVEEETMRAALETVERESLDLMAVLCTPE